MQILIFSDTHLDQQFERAKYTRLRELISQSDKIIINGDFWEGHGMSFEDFLKTQWATLFPLLKEKKAIYIYGNHDKQQFSDDRIYWFCDVATNHYETTINNVLYIFEHGDRLAPKVDSWLGIERASRFLFKISEWFQEKYVRSTGIKGLWTLFGPLNTRIKNKIKEEYKDKGNFVYVCGHTDCAEIDLPNHFVNGGIGKFGHLQYLTIDENGVIQQHLETYQSN